MGSIVLRENGSWQAKVRRFGAPDKSKTFATKTAAQAWLRQVERELDMGLVVSRSAAERTTLGQLIERFKAEFAPHHYRATTYVHKLGHIERRLGRYSLAALTPELVANYRDARLNDPDPRYTRRVGAAPKVSGATVKTELDLLGKVLDVSQKEFSITLPMGNVARSIRKPRDAAARDLRLSREQFDQLLLECSRSNNPLLRSAVDLSIHTAMRQGELLGLEWADVHLSERIIYLRETKNGEPRAVPLSTAAIDVLSALPRSDPRGKGKVFGMEKQTLYTAFKAACRRAGVPDFRWHDLRHEALSRLGERGDLSVFELGSISGHKTLKLLTRYTHIDAGRLAAKLG